MGRRLSSQSKLGVPIRTVTRKAGDFGTLWVGLPEEDLINARESATRALLLALLVTPLLMLPVGLWAGRRALTGLGGAADLADRIDPTRSLATLPLPDREDDPVAFDGPGRLHAAVPNGSAPVRE